jgi:predicted AAA+ superfamily ATPase
MKRDLSAYLLSWKNSQDRKPVLLRGARQVGKSYLAKELGRQFDDYIEINFELEPVFKSFFDKDLNPGRIIRDIALSTGHTITPGKTLLFLDEIQECPNAITSLRYFYEKMPRLHVIAAGSLIEFALEETGLPVGRINPLYLYPLSFMEFLTAKGHNMLREEIENHPPGEEVPEYFHQKLLEILGEYMTVGGMPKAVSVWLETEDLKKCNAIHQDLIDTFRQDFSKYARKRKQQYVEMVFSAIPRLLGKKFVFTAVSPDLRARELRPALELLSKAGIAHAIHHSSANGLPLGAEINPLISKVIFLDIALAQVILGIDGGKWILEPTRTVVNLGAITEAFVGQEILAYSPPDRKSSLYYWLREKSGRAEIDYITGIAGNVIPIEVKSGVTGSLKSLGLFLEKKKNAPYGIQLSQRNFFVDKGRRIHGYPLYAISSALKGAGEAKPGI